MRFVSVHIAFRSIDPFISLLSGSVSLLPVPFSLSLSCIRFSSSFSFSFRSPILRFHYILGPTLAHMSYHSSLCFSYSYFLSLALPLPPLRHKHTQTFTHTICTFLSLCPPSSGIETNLIDFLHLSPLSYLLLLLLLQSTLLHP